MKTRAWPFGIPGTYCEGDEGGGGGTPPPAPNPDPNGGTGGETEAERLKAEHNRELDRYRNEIGQERKRATELEKRLQQLEDANKTEQERLQARAEKATELEQQVATWQSRAEAAEQLIADEVTACSKDLEKLDKEMLGLLPEGTPLAQFAWLRRAVAKAQKDAADREKRSGLPPAGGRNPGAGNGKQEPTEEQRAQHRQQLATRF